MSFRFICSIFVFFIVIWTNSVNSIKLLSSNEDKEKEIKSYESSPSTKPSNNFEEYFFWKCTKYCLKVKQIFKKRPKLCDIAPFMKECRSNKKKYIKYRKKCQKCSKWLKDYFENHNKS